MKQEVIATKEKLFTTREASHFLGISEKEVIDLANDNVMAHFKLGGEFLRFRRDDLLNIRPTIKKKYNLPEKKHPRKELLREFLYFNDFYIISGAIIIALTCFILKDFIVAQ
jgi:excisionase family DNA binding protein